MRICPLDNREHGFRARIGGVDTVFAADFDDLTQRLHLPHGCSRWKAGSYSDSAAPTPLRQLSHVDESHTQFGRIPNIHLASANTMETRRTFRLVQSRPFWISFDVVEKASVRTEPAIGAA